MPCSCIAFKQLHFLFSFYFIVYIGVKYNIKLQFVLTFLNFILYSQYKIKSTAIVTACSGGVFFGIGIYRNDSRFYDDVMMPIVRLCSPELCHRLAVLGFKYNLFPRQREIDSERLVNGQPIYLLQFCFTIFS